ncbi:MAG: sodium:solute symporter family transporter [Vulcanimicrobiota bacterium]
MTVDIPAEFRFNGLDWFIIVLYFIGMIYLSIYLSKGQENQEDYYVGGRDLPWWAVGLSTMATQTSAISFISIPAFVALKAGGGLRWLQYELAVPLAMIFIMALLLPFFRKLELISVYEYLEMRFGKATRYFLAGVFLFSRGLGTAVGLYAAAIILSVCFGIPLLYTIILLGVVTLIYDTIGGMKAVVYSDVIQMGILMLGIIFCCYYALADVGGFLEAIRLFPKEQLVSLDMNWGFNGETFPFWGFLIGGFFLYSSYYGADQSQTQRELSAPTIEDTKKSLVFNGYFRFPLTLMYVLMGIVVGAYVISNTEIMNMIPTVNGEAKIDYMLPLFLMIKIPAGIKAIIFAAMLAAAMSSLDSAINSLSASTMRDFVEQFIDVRDTEKKYLFLSKVTTVCWGIVITVLAFGVKYMSTSVVESINKIGSAFYGPILAAFIVGVATRRVNGKGVIAGILAGVGINVVLWLAAPQIFWMWWNLTGFVVAVVTALLVSFATEEPDYEKIDKFIIWNSDELIQKEKKWIPQYLILVGYFFLILGITYYLPKILSGISV